MDSTSEEMGPTKGAVLAFLDFLVDPLLPARSTSREAIAHSQEVLVAKQVHAVVVLYNYHYRKQHPDMEFLDFQSFCKLAVALKPSLQLYFKIMKRTDAELEYLENLSLTEKAIMNACDTSKSLDASSNYPIIEGWPVAKVAVFLIDYKKENCYLFHGSITQGVWSAIEKEVNGSSQGSEVSIKKKRVIKKASKENQTADGTGHQQLAYLAVKDTCGINQCDLKILETHLVYSTSKPKTAVHLFIMQCTQTNQHENLVPINDVMDSLQGPLVRKDSISWIFTPVVEYFHLLPFADKVSDYLIREMSQDPVQHVEVEKDNGNCKGFLTRPEQLSNPSPMPKNSSQYVKAAKDDENSKDFHTRPKQPSNPMPQNSSQHVEAAKDDGYHKSFHIRPEQPSNPSHMPQNSSHVEVAKVGGHCKSSHIRPEQPSNPSHMPQNSSHVEVAKDDRIYKSSHIRPEQPSNPSHITQNSSHVEVAKDGGNCTSSHIRPEQLSNPLCMPCNSSHVGVAKDGGNCTSSHSRPEQLSIPSHMPRNSSQNVKEAKDDGKFISSHTRLEQLSNHSHMPQTASQHVEAAKDGGNRKSFHIRPEKLSNPSHLIAANKIEKCSGSPSMLEPLLNNSAKNRTLLQVEKEPSVNTSEQSCTLLNKKPLLIVPESLEAKETQEVRSGNNDHLKEGAAPSVDTHQLEEPRHPEVEEVVINSSSRRKWVPVEPVVYRKRNKMQKNNSSNKISRSNLINASTDSPSLAQEQCVATPLSLEKDTIAQGTDQTAVAESAIVVADIPVTSSNECDVEKNLSDNRIVDTVMLNQDEKQDHALVPFDADFKHLRKIQLTIASKEKLLSHTALNVLIRKREQLSLQVRNIEDELALCDRSIQTILSGSEDDLAVKIDSVLEGCNEICLKSSGAAGGKTALHFEDQDMPPVARRKRLSEANVSAPSPCQELDRICNSNYWILPTYNLSASKGGFLATVTVKGVDFECSSDGKMHMNPHEARNSAASNVLAKLRGMASES